MANAPRPSAPAQRPAAKMPNPAEGFDLLRPFRMAYNFTAGTIGGALEGMARWGSRGVKVGGVLGLLYGIANPVVIAAGAVTGIGVVGGIGLGLLGGAAVGIAFGTALGAATGGFTRASRAQAREDAAARARPRANGGFVSSGEHIDRVNDSNFDRQLQQNQENESYWRDHVTQNQGGHGRGF